MSILTYFRRKGSSTQGIVLPPREESGVLETEYNCIVTEKQSMRQVKRKRTTYRKDEKIKIAKYANIHGSASAIRHFKQDFPNLSESTIYVPGWLSIDRKKRTSSSECIQISERQGRPLLLPDEFDRKLREFFVSIRTAGGTINKHVIYGISMRLIKSDLGRFC